ncbi:MAG TPA: hypothetical protein VH796_19210 [Nitrososphaeraceae archaeon]
MKKGVVVFLDALGMKGVWNKEQNFIDKWKRVYNSFDKYRIMSEIAANSIFRKIMTRVGITDEHEISKITPRFKFSFFSDTIIITASSQDNIPPPDLLIPFVAHLLVAPFLTALQNNIFFRGSISIGNFYELEDGADNIFQSRRIALGPAIDEAAEYYTTPNWIGISTTPSASLAIEQRTDVSLNETYFVKYDIPTKDGSEHNGWALAWPKLDLPGKGFNETTERCRKYLSAKLNAEDVINKPLSISVYTKYRNTLDFYDFCNG